MIACVVLLLTSGGQAYAADIAVRVLNRSALAITTIQAISKSTGGIVQANLAGSIAQAKAGVLTIVQSNGQCVFDLAIAFGSAKTTLMRDVDVCQADAIAVE
jgi:hypothetical protein